MRFYAPRAFWLKSAMAACCMFALPQSAISHPHEWVEMQIKVLFNDKGEATGLRYNWLFDEFFTAYALSDYEKVTQQNLDDLLTEILGNIQEIGYFTKLEISGERMNTEDILGIATANAANVDDIRLQLNFDIPFAAPINPVEKPFRYAVFDPTFYIAMHHVMGDNAVTLEGAPEGCKATINPADPDPDMADFAASLDQTESGGDGLGIHFAEWVDIQCAQS